MDKERLIKIRQLFDSASNLPQSDREKFLNDKCDDESLKNEILSLLRTIEHTDDFIENHVNEAVTKRMSLDDPFIGKNIGSFIIDGKAGVGGMGIVYSGRRNDESFKQKVAIKILKQGLNSEYLLKRFLIERQTLANLQYPFIARLLDGGKTTEGLPYLVMEFIEGIPITEYCLKNNLNLNDKLKLFRDVCSAVQYAHQNLVVHRDIKPGNVLVTEDGHPKLLDFGIAKLLDENMLEEGEGLTRTGMWHLTPDYASPEQIKGDNITTASDIYSLGVMLYQILTNLQPYKITNNSPSAISRIITEENILKPSEKVKQVSTLEFNNKIEDSGTKKKYDIRDKLHHHLKGDLDNIVLKAMQKDPLRRYVSVEQFSEDIRRYLVGLPVIAQKDTAGYRLSKFIQRHKTGFVVSSIFVLFMIISIILIAWQANVAAGERDKARTEAVKVETVNKFLQDMLSSVDPNEIGKDVKVYDVLKKAADDVGKRFEGQPEIEAAIRKTIGKTLTNLGEFDQAKPHLDRALELNRKVYGNESNQAAASIYDIAFYYHWIADLKTADSLYQISISMLRRNKDAPPRDLANALNDYGILKNDFAEYENAKRYHEEALDIFIKNFGEKERDVASVVNNLAITLHELKEIDEAEKYFLKSLKLNIELFGEDSPEASSNYNNLGYIYVDKNDYTKAEWYYKKSLDLKIKYYGDKHSLVGLGLMNFGGFLFRAGKIDESFRYISRALENFNTSLNSDHIWVGMTNYWYGKVLLEKKEYVSAEKYLRNALKIQTKNYPEDHPNIITASGELGISLYYLKRYPEAEKLLFYGYQQVVKQRGEKNISAVRFLDYLIKLFDVTNQKDKAHQYKIISDNLSK
ncbi:MAG: tetratricopeptide repeat protein [Ignavibacteriales bacterium]|nr:MAG: tetratricopeptide repeat protein [Ignavibacteriales bacterium]